MTQSSAVLQLLFNELVVHGSPELEDLLPSEFPKHVRAIHSTQERAEKCPSYVQLFMNTRECLGTSGKGVYTACMEFF